MMRSFQPIIASAWEDASKVCFYFMRVGAVCMQVYSYTQCSEDSVGPLDLVRRQCQTPGPGDTAAVSRHVGEGN